MFQEMRRPDSGRGASLCSRAAASSPSHQRKGWRPDSQGIKAKILALGRPRICRRLREKPDILHCEVISIRQML